ncbi:MAG TPA: hypothetical protein VFH78_05950 [Candidatus Thermoplasmatota archaeon]|nr:hypothetical protein [Candidatus Thermoplasmatota archaeon]
MRSKKLSYVLIAAFVASAFLAFVPTAEAQQSGSVTVTLSTPENVKPLQGPVSFTGTVTFIGDYSGLTGVVGIPVTYSVSKAPAWASVLISPANDVFPAPSNAQPGTSYSQSKTITITVTASDQAPAFTPDTIEITATTQGAGAGGRSFSGKGNVPITATYFSIIDVQLAEAIKLERPQTPVNFPVKVSNFGNANTKVSFEVVDISPGLEYTLPIPVVLQSRQAGGSQISADIQLTIQTPYKNGYMNEVGTANYRVTSAYALDPKLTGDTSTVSLLITTRGFYVPGFSPLIFLAVLGGLALVLRRRD